jgi:hypothetical protein
MPPFPMLLRSFSPVCSLSFVVFFKASFLFANVSRWKFPAWLENNSAALDGLQQGNERDDRQLYSYRICISLGLATTHGVVLGGNAIASFKRLVEIKK